MKKMIQIKAKDVKFGQKFCVNNTQNIDCVKINNAFNDKDKVYYIYDKCCNVGRCDSEYLVWVEAYDLNEFKWLFTNEFCMGGKMKDFIMINQIQSMTVEKLDPKRTSAYISINNGEICSDDIETESKAELIMEAMKKVCGLN